VRESTVKIVAVPPWGYIPLMDWNHWKTAFVWQPVIEPIFEEEGIIFRGTSFSNLEVWGATPAITQRVQAWQSCFTLCSSIFTSAKGKGFHHRGTQGKVPVCSVAHDSGLARDSEGMAAVAMLHAFSSGPCPSSVHLHLQGDIRETSYQTCSCYCFSDRFGFARFGGERTEGTADRPAADSGAHAEDHRGAALSRVRDAGRLRSHGDVGQPETRPGGDLVNAARSPRTRGPRRWRTTASLTPRSSITCWCRAGWG